MSFDSLEDADFKIVTGDVHPELAKEINEILGGEYLIKANTDKFEDGETRVSIDEDSVRKSTVLIVHSHRPHHINDDLIQLSFLIQAATRASAREVIVLSPYLPYARQDRKDKPRVSISAKVVIARCIEGVGADSLICLDLHAGQLQGFSDHMPIDNLWPDAVFAPYIVQNYNLENICLLSPDAGGSKRIKKVRKSVLELCGTRVPWAVAEKERSSETGEVKVTNIIGGESLEKKRAVIIDDIASTCGTLIEVADFATKFSPLSIDAACTHGLVVGGGLQALKDSPVRKLITTDSIPTEPRHEDGIIDIIPMAEALSGVCKNAVLGKSISDEFSQT